MENDQSGDFAARLSQLSPQELKVLKLRCQGSDYETIAKTLFVSVPAVKKYMGRIYVKLELMGYKRAERMKLLFEKYCPLLQKTEAKTVEPEKPVIPPPEVIDGELVDEPLEPGIPPEVPPMVDEDEYAIVLVAPAPLVQRPEPRAQGRTLWLSTLVLVVVLGICLCGFISFLLLRSQSVPNPIFPQSTPTVSAQTAIPVNTPVPVPTEELPTQTPEVVVITATPPPTEAPTSIPAAVISLPFSDNFDNGANPNWKVLTGTWITVNGRYTPLGDVTNSNWFFTVLDDPTWQNYRVTLNVQVPFPYSGAQGEYAILIRISSSQPKYLAFYVDTLFRAGWFFLGGGYSDEKEITGTGSQLPDTANIEIDANGNSFTALVNGQQYQQITLPGYEHGGVGLGVICDTSQGKCPNFDNFKVEPLTP